MKKLFYILLYIPLALFAQDNYSLSFDGEDDYLGFSSNQLKISGSLSYSVRIKINDYTNMSGIIGRGEGTSCSTPNKVASILMLNNDGSIYWEISDDNTCNGLTSTVVLNLNQWYDVAVTWDGTNGHNSMKIYIDGFLNIEGASTITNISQSTAADDLFRIGNRDLGFTGWSYGYLNGSISNTSVWNIALSQQEIQSHVTCPPSGNEYGLIGCWNFNEGSGDTVYDLSGNGNHGTIHGATYSEDVPENNCFVEVNSNLQNIIHFSYGGFYDNSYYFLSQETTSWQNADSISNANGGYLVSITSEEENDFISSLLNLELEDAWMGLTDYPNEGDWVWSNGEIYEYNNWANNEPGGTDAENNDENYGLIHISGTWNDGYALTNHQYIMEIDAIYGCLDSLYYNYNHLANTSDGSCLTYEDFIIDSLESEFENLNENATTSISSLQQALDTWNTTIDLSAGWNMFGYGCPISIDLAEGLSNHTASIIITKDNNGNVYMPEFGFNGIGDFTPGFGYQIKLSEAIDSFSLCDWYVNDIPEDNIVSLQEENVSLYEQNQMLIDSINFLNLYQIGDIAEGGIIFYIDETGQHGLVAAIQYLDQTYPWGCYGTTIAGADGQAIGTGYQNTLDIVSDCSDSQIAASEALAYESEGYSDWYLPSFNELKEMYNTIGNGGTYGNIGGFSDGWHWSSSEVDIQSAWCVDFSDGHTSFTYHKYGPIRVRVIRSF